MYDSSVGVLHPFEGDSFAACTSTSSLVSGPRDLDEASEGAGSEEDRRSDLAYPSRITPWRDDVDHHPTRSGEYAEPV